MSRDSRYDILFEPVRIGPVVARNRFYQVPHCNGMGHRYPNELAAMRGTKAEGGWAVVSTEETEIHPSADMSPYNEGRIWDDADIPALRRMTDAVHEHGSLAAIELVFNGHHAPNLYSREVPLAPSHAICDLYDPVQARAMDLDDIRTLRRRHRAAALRARQAGFDIIYCYAGHDMALPMHFLSRRHNRRTDEYGGKLENRVRLFRELIEDTKEAVGDTCAVAVRLSVDELLGEHGITAGEEGREVIAMLAELPDLWDICLANWSNDSVSSRFSQEGYQEAYVAEVKRLTTKPVVGVGRFTSPDAMVSQIRRGILDFIGAARPSIADPFLPKKIEEGRIDDIRECIGCNVCVIGDNTMVPMRCTQNPTKGEEWRRDWHPERIAAAASTARVLVVGAGPAGLEATRALGQRGYRVVLAEAREELGGRVSDESRLPGLAAWARVRDYRTGQIARMPNVDVYRSSVIEAEHVLEFGHEHVVIATGATWRRDGIGREHKDPVPGLDLLPVFTPDDVYSGATGPDTLPEGPLVIYDDDHYYLGGVLAELFQAAGKPVCLITPASEVSIYTRNGLDQARVQRRLLELGVDIRQQRRLSQVRDGSVELACVYTDRRETIEAGSLLLVTMRLPNEGLRLALVERRAEWDAAGVRSVTAIGDALAPGIIAAAVHAGHRYARELDAPPVGDAVPFRRALPALA